MNNIFSKNTKLYVFIGIGGALGSLLRYAISVIPMTYSVFPFSTFLINISGCFILTFFTQFVRIKWRLSSEWTTFFTTGLIGSFTTFSTFAVETVNLMSHHPILATIYIFGSLFGGFCFSYFGYYLAKQRNNW